LPTNLVSLSSPDPEQEKHLLFTALAQFFTGQATKQPVLLIMEDIHWSDETSLEFLHYLSRRCTGIGFAQEMPLQILLTYRSDEVRPGLRHFLAQLDRERLAQEISLNRLTRSDVDAMLRGEKTLPFHYVDKGQLATIGRNAAVAQIGPLRIEGFVAWLIWLVVHILTLIGFRNRFLVMTEWAWVYLRYERGARLITGDVPPLLGAGDRVTRTD